MTKRTRVFVGISVGVLLLGLGAGLLASYYGIPGLQLTDDGAPDELAYLPQNSTVVAYANVRDVMNSDLRRRLTEAGQGADAQATSEFESRTGINVERDIEAVVASFSGADGRGRPLIVARGSFDQTRIETLMRGQGAQVEDYRGEQVFVIAADNESFALSFVESGVVAAGTVDAVRRAIDTKATTDSSVIGDDELMDLVRDMDEGTVWAVGRFDALAAGRLPEEVASRLPPISRFAVTSRINGGVEGLLRAETADAQAAQDLREVVQGFLALARLQSGEAPQLTPVLNSLQLGGQGTTVSLGFTVPAESLDALGAAMRQGRQQQPAPPESPRP